MLWSVGVSLEEHSVSSSTDAGTATMCSSAALECLFVCVQRHSMRLLIGFVWGRRMLTHRRSGAEAGYDVELIAVCPDDMHQRPVQGGEVQWHAVHDSADQPSGAALHVPDAATSLTAAVIFRNSSGMPSNCSSTHCRRTQNVLHCTARLCWQAGCTFGWSAAQSGLPGCQRLAMSARTTATGVRECCITCRLTLLLPDRFLMALRMGGSIIFRRWASK